MKREILFRAKSRAGEWVKSMTISKPFYHYKIRLAVERVWIICDEKTFGELSPLKDVNGNIVFQGDILKDANGYIYEVKLGEYFVDLFGIEPMIQNIKIYGWFLKDIEGQTYPYTLDIYDDLEVIGNIHDNPELLKL